MTTKNAWGTPHQRANDQLKEKGGLNPLAQYKVDRDLSYGQMEYRFGFNAAKISSMVNNKLEIPEDVIEKIKELEKKDE